MASGPFPRLEVRGAAYATLISQGIVTIIFYIYSFSGNSPFQRLFKGFSPTVTRFKRIFRIGIPVSVQHALFAIFAMFIARIAAGWGPVAVAVQSVGSQIEAVSWMTASGFATALSSFVGQNFGARNFKRIRLGYYRTLGMLIPVGLVASFLFIVFGEPIFSFYPRTPGHHRGNLPAYSWIFTTVHGYRNFNSRCFQCMGKPCLPPLWA